MNKRRGSASTNCRATSRPQSSEFITQAIRCVSHSMPFSRSNRTIASSLIVLTLSLALWSALSLTRLQLRSLVRLLRLAQDGSGSILPSPSSARTPRTTEGQFGRLAKAAQDSRSASSSRAARSISRNLSLNCRVEISPSSYSCSSSSIARFISRSICSSSVMATLLDPSRAQANLRCP